MDKELERLIGAVEGDPYEQGVKLMQATGHLAQTAGEMIASAGTAGAAAMASVRSLAEKLYDEIWDSIDGEMGADGAHGKGTMVAMVMLGIAVSRAEDAHRKRKRG